MYTVKSPLKAWEGDFSLPDPNEFTRTHWEIWRTGIEKPRRKSYANIHAYCYAGLELVSAHGEWNMSIPLAEVQAWENDPDNEKTKLVAFIGRELIFYIEDITNPKE